MSLKKLLYKLPSEHFVRVHQQYAINMNGIEIVDLENCQIELWGFRIPMGPYYKKKVIKQLQDNIL